MYPRESAQAALLLEKKFQPGEATVVESALCNRHGLNI